MRLVVLIAVLFVGFLSGVWLDPSEDELRSELVLVPTTAAEVEKCFDLADEIHMTRGGESAYNVCSENEVAYKAWIAEQTPSE